MRTGAEERAALFLLESISTSAVEADSSPAPSTILLLVAVSRLSVVSDIVCDSGFSAVSELHSDGLSRHGESSIAETLFIASR